MDHFSPMIVRLMQCARLQGNTLATSHSGSDWCLLLDRRMNQLQQRQSDGYLPAAMPHLHFLLHLFHTLPAVYLQYSVFLYIHHPPQTVFVSSYPPEMTLNISMTSSFDIVSSSTNTSLFLTTNTGSGFIANLWRSSCTVPEKLISSVVFSFSLCTITIFPP